MIRSYKDALLSTSFVRKNAMLTDGRLLLYKSHPLYEELTYQCATLHLLLKFCNDHAVFITKDMDSITLHESVYLKLCEFYTLVKQLVHSQWTCRCAFPHSPLKYANGLSREIRRYRKLPGVLLPVYIYLYKKLGNDVVQSIMGFITRIRLIS